MKTVVQIIIDPYFPNEVKYIVEYEKEYIETIQLIVQILEYISICIDIDLFLLIDLWNYIIEIQKKQAWYF